MSVLVYVCKEGGKQKRLFLTLNFNEKKIALVNVHCLTFNLKHARNDFLASIINMSFDRFPLASVRS